MRLYEVSGNQFQDDLANLLRVMQGNSNSNHTTSVVSWPAINNMMSAQGYAEINKDMLEKIKDQVDPDEELIQDITDQGITLKTDLSTPDEPENVPGQPGARSVDQMAHHAVSKGF
jgi:hypothetical protein